jgi:hypothetical protein
VSEKLRHVHVDECAELGRRLHEAIAAHNRGDPEAANLHAGAVFGALLRYGVIGQRNPQP